MLATTRMFAARFPRLILFLAVTALAVPRNARAQEKHRYSFKTVSGTGKYTQQHVIDVGDVPGHQIRLYELHYTFTTEAPAFEGVKVKETWTRATSDYTDGSGQATGYGLYLLETGEKIFSRTTIVAHTMVNQDGSKKTTFSSVSVLSGGTGRFRGIRGTLKTIGSTDFKAAPVQQTEGEYWIEKSPGSGAGG